MKSHHSFFTCFPGVLQKGLITIGYENLVTTKGPQRLSIYLKKMNKLLSFSEVLSYDERWDENLNHVSISFSLMQCHYELFGVMPVLLL